jgi:hypothetical protein
MGYASAVAIFDFQAKWNDFVTPLIYLNRAELYTMSLGLGTFKTAYEPQWALWMAAPVIVTLPMVLGSSSASASSWRASPPPASRARPGRVVGPRPGERGPASQARGMAHAYPG